LSGTGSTRLWTHAARPLSWDVNLFQECSN